MSSTNPVNVRRTGRPGLTAAGIPSAGTARLLPFPESQEIP